MTINECCFVLHDADLNRFFQRFVPPNNKVRGLHLELQDNKIVVSGRTPMFLNVRFQATLDVAHTDKEIIIQIESIRPMNGLLGQLKDKILRTIAEHANFIQPDLLNDAVRIDVNKALQARLADANLTIKELKISTGALALSLTGTLIIV